MLAGGKLEAKSGGRTPGVVGAAGSAAQVGAFNN